MGCGMLGGGPFRSNRCCPNPALPSWSLLQIEMLEHKYGGHLVSRRAACTIQTAFRQYQLSKNFEKIRNSLLESRLPRRISLRKVRAPTAESLAAERALMEGYGLLGLPLVRAPSLAPTLAGTLTELEDSFTEQVQSLAKSIDDALSTWSLKTMCSLQDSGAYQLHQALCPGTGAPDLEGDLPLREPESGHAGPRADVVTAGEAPCLSQGHSSTLMMAFRDVTVQIASQNISVSSSSTALSLANCLGTSQSPQVSGEPVAAVRKGQQGETSGQEVLEAVVAATDQGDAPLEDTRTEAGAGETLDAADQAGATQEVLEEVEAIEAEGAEEEDAAAAVAGEVGKGPEPEAGEQLGSESAKPALASEVSAATSKEALQAMILSLPRYHCENPASCKSPTLSTDTLRKRLYRIGLNLFNM